MKDATQNEAENLIVTAQSFEICDLVDWIKSALFSMMYDFSWGKKVIKLKINEIMTFHQYA